MYITIYFSTYISMNRNTHHMLLIELFIIVTNTNTKIHGKWILYTSFLLVNTGTFVTRSVKECPMAMTIWVPFTTEHNHQPKKRQQEPIWKPSTVNHSYISHFYKSSPKTNFYGQNPDMCYLLLHPFTITVIVVNPRQSLNIWPQFKIQDLSVNSFDRNFTKFN